MIRFEVRNGKREGVGVVVAQAARMGRARLRRLGGQRARAQRTWNIWTMSKTLDVSKLSGWLKANAPCRVEKRAYGAGRGAGREAEGVGAVAAQTTRMGRGRLEDWGGRGHARSAPQTCATCS